MTDKQFNLITKDLFQPLRAKEVLRLENKQLWLKDKALSREERDLLKTEAEALLKNQLFQILLEEMRYLGSKKIYEDSVNLTDLQFGKAVLWTVDILGKKVHNLALLR